MTFDLYYYHDPMCSWCWGYRPTADKLFASLPENIRLESVLGGLAPDSDAPMSEQLQQQIRSTWMRIESLLGTEFNFDFWTRCEPRRSTYPACRAVIAAGDQSAGDKMTKAIQQAYYLRARNPSDSDTLELLAGEIGLDAARFSADLGSAETDRELQRQVGFARRSPINGFPSLAIRLADKLVPVVQDYRSHLVTLDHIDKLTATAANG